jgi:serine/threonine-protein kinase BUR1
MFVRRPIFQGQSDMDQLDKIWWLCGTPTKENWPDFDTLPGLDGVKEFKYRERMLRSFLGRFDRSVLFACLHSEWY